MVLYYDNFYELIVLTGRYSPMGPPPYMAPAPQYPMGHAPYMGAGPSHTDPTAYAADYDDARHTFTMEDLCGGEYPADFDVIGSSQLPGAPLQPSQTPVPDPRPQRAVGSPDRLTYSIDHVRAQQRPKRTRTRRGG